VEKELGRTWRSYSQLGPGRSRPSWHAASWGPHPARSVDGADTTDEATAAHAAGGWKPPGVNEVGDWLLEWTLTWADQAGQAFGTFANAVRTDSHKSSNVGALISIAGNGLWVLGGLVENPPTAVLGAALSTLGSFVQGSGKGQDNNQLLLKLHQGLDKFTDQLNKGATNRHRWSHLPGDSGFRHAGSDSNAEAFLHQHLHISNTDHVGRLRTGIEKQLIGQYLHAKHAYIEHETALTLGGAITEDHLKGISGSHLSGMPS